MEAVVDSGAEESVVHRMFSQEQPRKRHVLSKTGGKYKAANGTRIPNLGQRQVRFHNDEGKVCGMGFQVVDVERPFFIGVTLGGRWKSGNIQGTRW